MSRKFIRKLEPYGYIDRNRFEPPTFGCNVDLTEINETNKEQDDEILEMKNRQSAINKEFNERITCNTHRIEALEAFSADTIVALDELRDSIEELDSRISGNSEDIAVLSGLISEHLAEYEELDETVDRLEMELDGKVDKSEAEAEHRALWDAINAEASARTDVDNQLWDALAQEAAARSDVDSQLWGGINGETVRAQGVEADLWAAIAAEGTNRETVDNQLWDAINAEARAREDGDAQITSSISEVYNAIDESENELLGKIEELEEKHDADIEALRNADGEIYDAIDAAKDELQSKIDEVDGKYDADIERLDAADEQLRGNITTLYERMATKQELEAEKTAREDGDNALRDAIDALRTDVDNTSDKVDEIEDKLDSLELTVKDGQDGLDGLSGRVDVLSASVDSLREDLIGTPQDPTNKDTIWAAKNLATKLNNEARDYIEQVSGSVRETIADLVDDAVLNIDSDFAKVQYVDSKFDDAKEYTDGKVSELDERLSEELANEVSRSTERDDALEGEVQNLLSGISENSSIIKAITSWNGEDVNWDPNYYENNGNGVLDVLHREFHDFQYDINKILDLDGNGDIQKILESGFTNVIFNEVTNEISFTNISGDVVTSVSISDMSSDVADLSGRVDTITEAVGLAEDGSYIPSTDSTYISGATSVNDAVKTLDEILKEISDKLGVETAAREAVDGISGNTYVPSSTSNYISSATSIHDATLTLDEILKEISDKLGAETEARKNVTGIDGDTYTPPSDTTFISGATSIQEATKTLDEILKEISDKLGVEEQKREGNEIEDFSLQEGNVLVIREKDGEEHTATLNSLIVDGEYYDY